MATLPRFFDPPGASFFLFGPRGTGKSTWMREHLQEALWLDLLDPETARACAARPEHLREMADSRPGLRSIVIDEVQRVPELLSVVHQMIERDRVCRFVLTGSSARKLKRTGVDLLAGRALLRRMHPFMAAELGEAFRLADALQQGMLPLVFSSPSPRETLRSYVALYVREEVQHEGLVRSIGGFSRFLEAISFSHASVLNLTQVARECQVSRKTVEGYVEILEDLLLSFRLPVFTRRASRQLSAHPKFYWFDAGVFRAMRPVGPLDSPEEVSGAALEGLVAQHLRAWLDLSGAEGSLHFWRTRAGNEVDFILYAPQGLWALEVKRSRVLRPQDFSGLRSFLEDYPEATGLLLYGGTETLQRHGILCLPVDRFLRVLVPGQPLPRTVGTQSCP